ncbi:MAG TPA: hypothetical protein VE476_06170 [Propionibacteriaceae bacterium]|nr:hypothetical protein [Propionibacteriaceae bacterium]
MSRLAPRLLALVAAVVLGLLGAASNPQPAFACECSPITPTRAARQADAVFRGTVTALRKVDRGDGARTDIRFAVDAVYKGSVYAEQVVATPRESTECGLTPQLGTTWVIFSIQGVEGSGDDAVARLITDNCRGNLPTANAPRVLGTPRVPMAGASDREERATGADRTITRGLAIGGIALLTVGAIAVAGLAVLWRPGRAR